jgi:hypothetical protein
MSIHCRYCLAFQEAKWRVSDGPEPEDEGPKKKNKPKLRYCAIEKTYIKGVKEICDRFDPSKLFWCNLYEHWIYVDACISKHNRGEDEGCNRCYQHKNIVEIKKAIIFKEREAKALEAELNKPKLIKRENHEG